MEQEATVPKPAGLKRLGQDMLLSWLIPFCVFVVVMVLYTYCFMQVPGLCIAATVVFGLASIISGLLAIRSRKVALPVPMAISLLSATVVGTLLGLAFYDRYAMMTMFYVNSPLYPNVMPYQDSAGVADAGRIVFTSDTRLLKNYSVSFVTEQGYVFCVAPIYDDSPITQIQFWAGGIDCCEDGHFHCDSADFPAAHAGIVIFDSHGYFGETHLKYYDRARVKAQALYKLNSTKTPLYVRWVHEGSLAVLKRHYRYRAIVAVFASLSLYLVITATVAYHWHKPVPLNEVEP